MLGIATYTEHCVCDEVSGKSIKVCNAELNIILRVATTVED